MATSRNWPTTLCYFLWHFQKYIYLFIWVVLVLSCSVWNLVPWSEMEPRPPVLGAQSYPLGSPLLHFLMVPQERRKCWVLSTDPSWEILRGWCLWTRQWCKSLWETGQEDTGWGEDFASEDWASYLVTHKATSFKSPSWALTVPKEMVCGSGVHKWGTGFLRHPFFPFWSSWTWPQSETNVSEIPEPQPQVL